MPVPEGGLFTDEGAARLDFTAQTFDAPLRNVPAWSEEFRHYALGMHIADRFLRMDKAEAVEIVRRGDGLEGRTTEMMFKAITSAQQAFEVWAKQLDIAACRYAVAISTATVERSAEPEV